MWPKRSSQNKARDIHCALKPVIYRIFELPVIRKQLDGQARLRFPGLLQDRSCELVVIVDRGRHPRTRSERFMKTERGRSNLDRQVKAEENT